MALADKKLFLLDMDGTIYLDYELFDGTLDFLSYVKQKGGKYLFVTNNSSKGVGAYIEKMKILGIEAGAEDFLTSVDATVAYIRKYHSGKRFYCMGTKSFVSTLIDEGIDVVSEIGEGIEGILLGYDTELTYKKLDDVCRLLSTREYLYLATNPDVTCPTSYGFVPDLGSISVMIKNATGKMPRFIGKPEPDMILMALEKFGYQKEDAVMIGDRLYTDIASGVNAGIDTVFVLSGEGTLLDLKTSEVKPTYIYKSIKEMLENIK